MKNYSVIDLLNNHSKLRARTNMLKGKNIPSILKEELEEINSALELLDICIMGLQKEEQQLIKLYYYEGYSGRRLSNELCMGKSTIYRKRDKILAELQANYNILSKKGQNGTK